MSVGYELSYTIAYLKEGDTISLEVTRQAPMHFSVCVRDSEGGQFVAYKGAGEWPGNPYNVVNEINEDGNITFFRNYMKGSIKCTDYITNAKVIITIEQ
jgi:hypothetical protein